jgi:prefoldin subunit 5
MKLFSFGKKKQGPAMPSPTARVLALSSQGLSEPEIIQTLRQEGFTPIQVDTAMRDALRGAASGAGPAARPAGPRYAQQEYEPQEYRPARRPEPPPLEEFPDEASPYPRQQRAQLPPIPQPPMDFEEFKRSNKELGFPEIPGREPDDVMPRRGMEPEERMPRPRMRPEDEFAEEDEERPIPRFGPRDRDRSEKRHVIEELTEGVVEEKWQDFRRRIDDMSSMFQQLNERISVLEQKLGQAQGEKKSDLTEIEDKIDTYKHSIDEIQSRMESVEHAMKDSLTPMMQTLRSLSETIKSLKERKG